MKQIIPKEFDISPKHGFILKGWDFDSKTVSEALEQNRMLNPAIELGINVCPWNCDFCFTEEPGSTEKIRSKELSIGERLKLIDDLAALGTKSINFIGAGEPTIDPDFWTILERMRTHNITPIVYTEGSLKLIDKAFAKKLFDIGATVVLKVNSMANEKYQNAVVNGTTGRKRPMAENYFQQRNEALDVLMKIGFNKTFPTRLAFDTIICKENVNEILDIHRFTRQNNIFVLFVNYLTSGRSTDLLHNAISSTRQKEIFRQISEVDKKEFGLAHDWFFPYAGCAPCTIRGLGLYVKINGDTFDCPGELQYLGNIKKDSITDLWKKTDTIRKNFDFKCAPREKFWKNKAR